MSHLPKTSNPTTKELKLMKINWKKGIIALATFATLTPMSSVLAQEFKNKATPESTNIISASTGSNNANNLVNNGDFEKGASQTEWDLIGAMSIVNSDNYRVLGSVVAPYTDRYIVIFNDGDRVPNGSISQTISTVAGQKYVLSFFYGNYKAPGYYIGTQSIKINILDSSNLTSLINLIITDPTTSNNLDEVLSSYSLSFIATSTQTKIEFSDNGSDTESMDGILDNISVTPVP
ncbi:MAG: DUF642 domain-containing protein [Nostoc sp.]